MCRILQSILKRTPNVEYIFFNIYDTHTTSTPSRLNYITNMNGQTHQVIECHIS